MTHSLENKLNAFFGGKSAPRPRKQPKSDTVAHFPDGRAERIKWRRDVRRYQTEHYSARSLKQIKKDMETFEPGVTFSKEAEE